MFASLAVLLTALPDLSSASSQLVLLIAPCFLDVFVRTSGLPSQFNVFLQDAVLDKKNGKLESAPHGKLNAWYRHGDYCNVFRLQPGVSWIGAISHVDNM
jgi:hypothetical protein